MQDCVSFVLDIEILAVIIIGVYRIKLFKHFPRNSEFEMNCEIDWFLEEVWNTIILLACI